MTWRLALADSGPRGSHWRAIATRRRSCRRDQVVGVRRLLVDVDLDPVDGACEDALFGRVVVVPAGEMRLPRRRTSTRLATAVINFATTE